MNPANRIWRRYFASPGVIPTGSLSGKFERQASFAENWLPMLVSIQRRWTVGESSLAGADAFSFHSERPIESGHAPSFAGAPQDRPQISMQTASNVTPTFPNRPVSAEPLTRMRAVLAETPAPPGEAVFRAPGPPHVTGPDISSGQGGMGTDGSLTPVVRGHAVRVPAGESLTRSETPGGLPLLSPSIDPGAALADPQPDLPGLKGTLRRRAAEGAAEPVFRAPEGDVLSLSATPGARPVGSDASEPGLAADLQPGQSGSKMIIHRQISRVTPDHPDTDSSSAWHRPAVETQFVNSRVLRFLTARLGANSPAASGPLLQRPDFSLSPGPPPKARVQLPLVIPPAGETIVQRQRTNSPDGSQSTVSMIEREERDEAFDLPMSKNSGAGPVGTAPGGFIDLSNIAERVWRLIDRRLAVERERRGMSR